MIQPGHRYFAVYKPYNMVSQFVSPDDVRLLHHIDFSFPEGIHAVGRLDINSEGLLLLTTNKKVTRLLFESAIRHERAYLVKVKGIVSEQSLQQLRDGVTFLIKGSVLYTTTPCKAEIVAKPASLAPGEYEYDRVVPHTWLLLTLTEGKFHQVRKMVKTVGHRCQRLIRVSIGNMTLGNLQPGAVEEMEEHEFFRLLGIDNFQ
jgi:23S rRNA pseudouridine2457 synthase